MRVYFVALSFPPIQVEDVDESESKDKKTKKIKEVSVMVPP